MRTVYLITSSNGKIRSIKSIIRNMDLGFKLKMIKAEYPEDKTEETTRRVVLGGAKWCVKRYNRDVLVTDTGLFIDELKGFPGVNTKFALTRIGNGGLLKLMKGKRNRNAEWILSIGYCRPGGRPVEFTAYRKGRISHKVVAKGFGFDTIFIPNGYSKTFSEAPHLRDELSPFKTAIIKFSKWYKLQSVKQ